MHSLLHPHLCAPLTSECVRPARTVATSPRLYKARPVWACNSLRRSSGRPRIFQLRRHGGRLMLPAELCVPRLSHGSPS